MGSYLNIGSERFREISNSEIYIDKTGMLKYTNSVIHTMQKCICISRPRRFGKSIAAVTLAAYYGSGCDSRDLFQGMEISKADDFEEHLNKYDVISLNMQEFLSQTGSMEEMLGLIRKTVLWDLLEEYPDFKYFNTDNLARTMQDIYNNTKRPFIVIIDEWDCIFREYKERHDDQNKYLDFLRDLLKDKGYIHLAYMTGILPIKKYGTHSALNMFSEFSMTNAGVMADYFGFTDSEVQKLCSEYGMSYEDTKSWYNGYCLGKDSAIYNPRSVVEAMLRHTYDTYWNQTETFEALRAYIDMNFDGLKDAIIKMLAGARIQIDVRSFVNDMVTFHSFEDVLTLLVHLGYLTYDRETEEVYIPNKEISKEYITAVRNTSWGEIIRSVRRSNELLSHLWELEAGEVATGIEQAHYENSILQYNDENALSYTISLALYAAREYYTIIRELPTGKGFADMVFLPKPNHMDKPALLVELKWDKSAKTAIDQIKEKHYVRALEDYQGKLIIAGVNYDRDSKKHECVIEEV
jgi:hypothetical protein